MAHLLISAEHKSSGKTTVSAGLAAALSRRGLSVQTFKKGPDYIDPLWLTRAAGRACRNLDFFTQSEEDILAQFAHLGGTADISLIEGNKGLYDGLDVTGRDSNAALAKLLGAPVILVIDTQGMTRGVAPLVRGYLDFDPAVDIKGVILNKVGGSRHGGKLRAVLQEYTDLPILGAVERDPGIEIAERHLGLVPANEAQAADDMIGRLADAVSAQVDLDRVLEIARGASLNGAAPPPSAPKPPEPDIRIAVARDAAFGFYYPDDLEAFARAGAELVPFDTLADGRLPEADGLFIGGGFPETQMAALAANKGLLADIGQAVAGGLPTYAECGGMMYLARRLSWRGETAGMAGVIPADVVVHERPRGRGYMLLEETGEGPWGAFNGAGGGAGAPFPAHEFHYAAFENLPGGQKFAYRVKRGEGLDGVHDGLVMGNLLANFTHLRNVGTSPWVGRFVDFVRAKKAGDPSRK